MTPHRSDVSRPTRKLRPTLRCRRRAGRPGWVEDEGCRRPGSGV